jgi:hypothetical protein
MTTKKNKPAKINVKETVIPAKLTDGEIRFCAMLKGHSATANIISGGITAMIKKHTKTVKKAEGWKSAIKSIHTAIVLNVGDANFRPFAHSFKSIASRIKRERFPANVVSKSDEERKLDAFQLIGAELVNKYKYTPSQILKALGLSL